jgi:predicted ester cyclase
MKTILKVMIPFAMAGFIACKQPMANTEGVSANNMAATNMESVKKVYAFMNAGKLDSLDGYIAADFIDHNPDPMQKGTGLAGMKEMMKIYSASSPDMKMEANTMMADGDLVMVHATVSGTNTGAMGPKMPATNKSWKVDMYEKMKITNGKCVERWGVFDMMTMMSQLGMLPPGMGGSDAGTTAPAAPEAKK